MVSGGLRMASEGSLDSAMRGSCGVMVVQSLSHGIITSSREEQTVSGHRSRLPADYPHIQRIVTRDSVAVALGRSSIQQPPLTQFPA